jgi:predicted  nucleic acid-binding Zn-ribbon protein
MRELRASLLELQNLDNEILRAEQELSAFEPKLAALEEPVRLLEQEIEAGRTRLSDMRQNARRLELAAETKRDRLRQYEARMERVRNVREESAARTEMDLIRRATEADEGEALEMMDQATRTDLKLDELIRQLEAKRAELAPRREELLTDRQKAQDALAMLRDQRKNHVVRLDAQALRLYERVRGGRARVAVAPLTVEGACGNCYNVLPIQQQSEVRRSDALVRCEQCGVILYPAEASA